MTKSTANLLEDPPAAKPPLLLRPTARPIGNSPNSDPHRLISLLSTANFGLGNPSGADSLANTCPDCNPTLLAPPPPNGDKPWHLMALTKPLCASKDDLTTWNSRRGLPLSPLSPAEDSAIGPGSPCDSNNAEIPGIFAASGRVALSAIFHDTSDFKFSSFAPSIDFALDDNTVCDFHKLNLQLPLSDSENDPFRGNVLSAPKDYQLGSIKSQPSRRPDPFSSPSKLDLKARGPQKHCVSSLISASASIPNERNYGVPPGILSPPIQAEFPSSHRSDPVVEVYNQPKHIYVSELPQLVDEATLRKVFRRFGKIDDVRLSKSKTTGQMNGVAYIKFACGDSVFKSLGADNSVSIGGRKLRIARTDPMDSPTRKLFFANVWDMTESDVVPICQQYGVVVQVDVVADRGMMYVHFAKIAEAINAHRSLQGLTINHRYVRVEFGQSSANYEGFNHRPHGSRARLRPQSRPCFNNQYHQSAPSNFHSFA